ncbi:hypothetical protein NQ314_004812, partial [Rhamnusium bicolor]
FYEVWLYAKPFLIVLGHATGCDHDDIRSSLSEILLQFILKHRGRNLESDKLSVTLRCKCAPRGKHSKTVPQTVYDQKQTGDYNIQLHLKDFQIIALLSDDSIGAIGDYDYNYDYSEFTVKPATQKPSVPPPSQPPSNSQIPENPSSTLKPANHPYPVLVPSTTQPPEEKPLIIEEKPINNPDKPNKEQVLNEVDKTENLTIASSITEKVEVVSAASEKIEEPNSPGQIKVQIIETPIVSAGAVPGEQIHDQNNEAVPQGEILQLRRCSTGFTRDKKGKMQKNQETGSCFTTAAVSIINTYLNI